MHSHSRLFYISELFCKEYGKKYKKKSDEVTIKHRSEWCHWDQNIGTYVGIHGEEKWSYDKRKTILVKLHPFKIKASYNQDNPSNQGAYESDKWCLSRKEYEPKNNRKNGIKFSVWCKDTYFFVFIRVLIEKLSWSIENTCKDIKEKYLPSDRQNIFFHSKIFADIHRNECKEYRMEPRDKLIDFIRYFSFAKNDRYLVRDIS